MKIETKPENIPQGIHILAKPIGPRCNLDCEYCFYLEKQALFPKGEDYVMPDEVLRAYINKYITLQPTPVVGFVWQGGEPTLLGLDFYKRVIELQRPFTGKKEITNSLQTNGILLDDEWCAFLKENDFLVGLSLDGPKDIHDRYRKDRGGKGSYDKVMRGMDLLHKHGVEFNVMATVARETAYKPLEVYRFFKEQGVEFIQFTPVIERIAGPDEKQLGLKLAGPSSMAKGENAAVTEWSVDPEQYGDFLITVFDEWVRNDVGTTNVMNFEWALNAWIGNSSPVCQHAHSCGKTIMLEHNGDIYACDHSMYPEYKLGNIVDENPVEMAERSIDKGFGVKDANLPNRCMECNVLKACWGGCPKHRFARTYNDEPLYYLCEGYKKYLLYIRKYLKAITQLLENGLPASHIMEACKGPLVINLANRI
ncbi:MAG: anaerobic sulfatase maturase [Deltaproteobacteria bacterium]|nr:anaerobic sulfatase maturase [Deltaproteobacteria bacterium]